MIDGKKLFDQPINNDFKTYGKTRKNATGQGDDYTSGCLLHYPYFRENYKMIAIDISKQQALDADPRANNRIILLQIQIEQEMKQCFSVFEEEKKNCNRIFTRNRKSFVNVLQNTISWNNVIVINIKWFNVIV